MAAKKESTEIAEVPKGRKTKAELAATASAEQIADITKHNYELASMPKIDFNSPDAVKIRSDDYIRLCVEHGRRPSIEGYALALGINKAIYQNLRMGKSRIPQESVEILQRMQALFTAQMVDYMQEGKINPVSGIFIMRNDMGYTNDDTKPLEADAKGNTELSAEEIAKKYGIIPD